MPALSNLITMINTSISTNSLSSNKFQNGKYYNIADPVRTYDEDGSNYTEPMIIDNNGECVSLVFDDNYPFKLFHVIDDIEYIVPTDDYGSGGTTMQEVANAKLIFAGSRKSLKTSQEDIMAAIVYDIPKEFVYNIIQPLNITSAIIEIGSVSTNIYDVWEANWKNTRFRLNTDTFIFSIKYKIVTEYNSCFGVC